MSWRSVVRAIHRDTGYAAVGLTLVYAVSGAAVNHRTDWDPSFRTEVRTTQMTTPLPADDASAAAAVLRHLALDEPPRDILRTDRELQITLERHTIVVDVTSGAVRDEAEEPRMIVYALNWLHLNRGKRAWTYLADLYALALVYLAVSGLFMLPGKNGVRGRGAVFVAVGAAIPILYVLLGT